MLMMLSVSCVRYSITATPTVHGSREVSLQLHPYPFYDGAVGHMPTFSQVEPSCYHHPHADPSFPTRFWTPLELFEYARDDLHVSYMFWARWRWRPFPDSYNWWDAIPVIESHPDFNLD